MLLLALADGEDVVDAVNDLADLFVILVLSIDLVFEVLLQRTILLAYLLQVKLQALHLPLLLIQRVLELAELDGLLLSCQFHLLVDGELALHQFLVLALQVLEPVL